MEKEGIISTISYHENQLFFIQLADNFSTIRKIISSVKEINNSNSNKVKKEIIDFYILLESFDLIVFTKNLA